MSFAVSVHSTGSVYIAGSTRGSLGGPSAGDRDAFLAKYDSSGAHLWTRQLGTRSRDDCSAVAVDAHDNAYVCGVTGGSLGGPSAGSADVFLAKYDASGNQLWIRQLGSPGGDSAWGVAVNAAGDAYIAGSTTGSLGGTNMGSYDAFLAKYDSAGTLLWTRQIGTPTYDHGLDVALDGAGNAYISGRTEGSLGGPHAGNWDAFLAKYDGTGVLLWSRQLGTTSNDHGAGVGVDSVGNAYITGKTSGSLGGPKVGEFDAFLAKYDSTGALLWIRQLGTPTYTESNAVSVDNAGNAYIGGWTQDSLGGPFAGILDAFLAKYDALGTLLWARQIGTPGRDFGTGVGVDGAGNAYLTGYTDGSLSGTSAGDFDAFLVKYGDSCYADCDQSGILDIFDFLCFQNSFVLGEPYACECNPDPACDIFDFLCFQTAFVAGCP